MPAPTSKTGQRLYRGGDDQMRDGTSHVAYLRDCAARWRSQPVPTRNREAATAANEAQARSVEEMAERIQRC